MQTAQNLYAARPPVAMTNRRVVIIRRNLQVRYALILLGLLVAACFMVWWEMSRSLLSLIDTGFITDLDTIRMLRKIFFTVGYKTALFLSIAWILAIALAHTIIRPVYRFEKCFEALKVGNLRSRVQLEKNDEFKFLAAIFNESMAFLHQKARDDQKKAAVLSKSLTQLAEKASSDTKDDLIRIAKEVDGFKHTFKT